MATRRKTASKDTPVPSVVNGTLDPSIMRSTPSAAYSPFLPTVLESILLAVYPLILLLGSLYATFHPALRTANYLPDAQSYDPRVAPSYFAKKNNVFNIYFVKVGWVWMTLAFAAIALTRRRRQQQQLAQAGLRYLCVTAVWLAVTQWFFGPAIIDRSFRWTGGQCEAALGDAPEDRRWRDDVGDVRETLTHAACKAIGGTWRGGHDISGHVFLLILGSAMLLLEALPTVVRRGGLRDERTILAADGSVQDATIEGEEEKEEAGSGGPDRALGVGIKGALAVAGLSWWMLLMTAAYFHTWFEKLTGSLVAFTAIYLIYFLPRAVPALRSILGLPGV